MTSAKIQPFCRRYNIKIRVYNKKQRSILPKTTLKEEFVYLFTTTNFALYGKTINQVSLML